MLPAKTAASAPSRSKRAKTRDTVEQPGTAAGTTAEPPEAAGRPSRAERQRNRAGALAAAAAAAAAGIAPVGGGDEAEEAEEAEEEPSPQQRQPAKKRRARLTRRAGAPDPDPAPEEDAPAAVAAAPAPAPAEDAPGAAAAAAPAAAPAAAAPAAAPASCAAAGAPKKRDFRYRKTDDGALQNVEAAARAAAAAAAAAAVATERTVAVASPALRPWFCSTPVRVAEFARAAGEALEEVDRVLLRLSSSGGSSPAAAAAAAASSAAAAPATPPPLAAAALLAEAEATARAAAEAAPGAAAAAPPPPPLLYRQRTHELPPIVPLGRAIALGPGGGRPLVPGKDVLVTLSLSEAGRPERPLREVVLLATPPSSAAAEGSCSSFSPSFSFSSQTLQDARDGLRNACSADAAAEELGVSVQGAYCAVEGVIHTDNRSSSSSSPPPPPVVDYASPILEFLAATGSMGPLPPREGEGAEARAAVVGRGEKWRRRQRRMAAAAAAAAASAAAGGGGGAGAAAKTTSPPPAPPPAPYQPPPAPWRAGDLSTALLSELTLRLGGGSGYVFCHQGGCEHALAVRDVRLACADDAPSAASAAPASAAAGIEGGNEDDEEEEDERHPPTSGDFPLLLFRARTLKARCCQACGSRRAARATWRDAAAPSDPAFWCQRCYGDAHYDDSGNLLVPEHRVVDYRGG